MKEKWMPHIVAAMAFVFFIVLGLASASGPSEYELQRQAQVQAKEERERELARAQELILGTEISRNLGAGEEYWFILQAAETGRVAVYTSGSIDTYLEAYDSNNRLIASNDDGGEGNNARLVISVGVGGAYLFKLRGYERSDVGPYRIIAIDEAADAEARRIIAIDEAADAEARRLAEEARRLADEEANRYDPSRFTLVPSNFRPADYRRADLFSVVAWVEGMDLSVAIPNLFNRQTNFVSDVVFVRQDGTDIRFRTDDSAISQTMRINARSGLTAGQRVRLYYEITKEQYRLPVWTVLAIERL